MLTDFDYGRAQDMQFAVNLPWISAINSRYILGVDGISLPLLMLTLLVVPLCIIYSWNHFPEPHDPKSFLILLLVLETGMIGTFIARDLILFFVFFEVVLLPMYFMIGVWGGEQRQYAAIKFFLYTLFGSALMIVAFLALYFLSAEVHVARRRRHGPHVQHGAAARRRQGDHGRRRPSSSSVACSWASGSRCRCSRSTPGCPTPTRRRRRSARSSWPRCSSSWAPTASCASPCPILPEAARSWAPAIAILAVIGIIYGALCCLAQTDMKRLIAFSSVAHMGFVMLAIATMTEIGINAAIFGMVAHGLITGMLFFVAGSTKERYHTLEINRLGGLLVQAPRTGLDLRLLRHGVAGPARPRRLLGRVPGHPLGLRARPTGSSEGLFRTLMVIAALGTVFAAGYLLWLYQRVAFGTPKPEFADDAHIHDTTLAEWIAWAAAARADRRVRPRPRPHLQHHRPRRHRVGPPDRPAPQRRRRRRRPTEVPKAPLMLLAFTAPPFDAHAFAPEIILVSVLAVALLVDLFVDDAGGIVASLTSWGFLGALVPLATLAWSGHNADVFADSAASGSYLVDNYALVLKALFLLAGYLVVLLSMNYIGEGDYWESEYYFLLIASVLGMTIMASARDLITMFIALETLSIPAYMLAAWRKRDAQLRRGGHEVLPDGRVRLVDHALRHVADLRPDGHDPARGHRRHDPAPSRRPARPSRWPSCSCSSGFGFKVSAVPFHQWAPDTYEGAPTPVTAFLAVASKAAGFVALVTLLFVGFRARTEVFQPLMWALAAVTMFVGNFIALRQTNVVRMLAYSGIAQAGYMLAPLAIVGQDTEPGVTDVNQFALQSIVTYLIIYAFMNLGAFGVVIAAARKTALGRDRLVRRHAHVRARPDRGHDHLPVLAGRHPAAGRVVRQVRHLRRPDRRPTARRATRWPSSSASTR